MSAETNDSVTVKSKLKKKSIIERELETSLTEKLTSPVLVNDKSSTSRYGRVRRSKTDSDFCENIVVLNSSKSPKPCDKSLNESTVHTHTSRSPIKKETPLKSHKLSLDSQIENIYNENQMMSRFASEKKGRSASIKSPKIYVRKDLIQRKEKEETITLIKNMFSPGQSPYKPSNSNSNYSDRSSEKYSWNKSHNGHTDLASVVKTLDFGSNKKKKKERDAKVEMSKSDLFDLEAKCYFQVGDLAWARIGTFPFWPCIVTRDPETGMFVKKKLFGKTQRDIINVTFCNDNGRRSWVVDNMLRSFKGKAEFMETREKFTPETKKKDPRLFAAFFVSDKKQHLWNLAIEEAETLLKEPKRFRIDLLNEMIYKARAEKFESRRSSKVTRTDSDVSLSESLYDSLFSEEDVKEDSHDRSRVKSRNKSFDVSDVVTACLDNMAAKTGITKIKKQSHMDRWLQKAKSKTPEKTQSLAHMSSQKTSENKIGSMKKSSLQSRSRSSRMSNRKSGQKLTDDTVINIDVSESTNYVVDPCNIVNESVENGPQVNGSDIIENVGENTETGLRFDIIAKVECLSDHNLEEPIEEQSSFDVAMVTDEVDHSNINSTEINNEQNVNTEKEVENASNVDNLILNNVSSDKNCDYLNLNEVVDFNNYKTINKKPADSPITELISDAAVLSQEPEILDKTTENNAQLIENTLAVAASNSQFSESTISNVSSYDDVVMRDAEKEALEQINEKLGNHDECSKIVNEEDNCNNSITDKSLQATVTIYEDDLRDAQMHSPKNIDREENTVAINEENQQNDPDKNKALEILTQTEAVENSVQNTSWDTVCEDVEMKDATEHNNDELSKKEEESSKDKTMNDLVNEIGCKKKTKDLQDMIFNASVAENNANQVNGTIESESKVSSNTTDIEKRLEKTFYQNKACEYSSPESTKIRKRFSLRRNNKDKINHLNEKSSYIKSRTDQITCRNVQITIEKNKEIDLYIQKSQGLVNIDKSNIEDQRSNEIVSNKKVKNIEEINIVQNSDERANPKNDLDFTLSNQSEESPNDNSRKVKNRDKKSNKSEIYMNGDTHMEFIENNVDFSENNPVSSKKKSKKVLHKKFRSTDLDSSQNGSSSSTTMSRKDKHNTDDLNSPEVEPNFSEITSKNHDQTSKDDLDSCENNLNLPKNTPKKVIHNEASVHLDSCNKNSKSTELTDSASTELTADSIKLNITDVEVSISDGNIPKITPSVEITQKSLHRLPLSKLSRKVHEDDIDTLSLNSNASSSSRRSSKRNKKSQVTLASENTITEALKNPEFLKYTEMRQDQILDENPDLTQDDLIKYLYKTWLYEEEIASKEHNETRKNDMDFCENILNLPKNTSEKDIQNEISVNDLDSRNDKENPESTELIDSAKADSIKLNITDVEVSISDGNIPKITPSVEITQKSLHRLPLSKLSRKVHEDDIDTLSLNSNASSSSRRSSKRNKKSQVTLASENTITEALKNPEFVKYTEMRQDQILVENPDLTQDDLIKYLYKTWLYEEEIASKEHNETRKNDMDSCENILNLPKNTSEKDIQNEISLNDLDSRNDKENPESTELIDSAKADSIKLNITDVEVSISDGSIHKITPSVEITEKSDILNKKDNLDMLDDFDSESINSENSEVPLSKLSRKIHEDDLDTVSLNSNTSSSSRRSSKRNKKKPILESENTIAEALENPEFVKYMEMRQDQILDENPDLTQDDLIKYLYKTWLYEEEIASKKHSETRTNDMDSCENILNIPKNTSEKDIHNEISVNDLDSRNDKENSDSTELIDSAKADSIKLNITDVEVSISDGNIPKITPSVEITEISDVLNKKDNLDILDGFDSESINSENSEVPLSKLSRKIHEDDLDTVSLNFTSSSSRRSSKRNKKKPNLESDNTITEAQKNPEFVKYMEMRQDQILDKNPDLTQDDLIKYLYKTWLYEEELKSDRQKTDELESSKLVKGLQKDEQIVKPKRRVNKLYNNVRLESMSVSSDENETTSKRSLRSRTNSPLDTSRTSSPCEFPSKEKVAKVVLAKFTEEIIPEINKIHNECDKNIGLDIQINKDIDPEVASIDSENSDVPLIQHKLHIEKMATKLKASQNIDKEIEEVQTESKVDENLDALSLKSEESTSSFKKGTKPPKDLTKALDDPEFVKYLELRQDNLMDEHPELTHEEIVQYLHKTWLYEESSKSETMKIDEIEQLNLVKGLNNEPLHQPKKIKKKKDKEGIDTQINETNDEIAIKDKPRRKVAPACYNEEYFDLDVEEEIQYFDIFKKKPKIAAVNEPIKEEIWSEDASESSKITSPKIEKGAKDVQENIKQEIVPINSQVETVKTFDKAEIYFQNLTKPKPNVFKGMAREKVCEICSKPSQLVKCKGCFEMFHVECVKKETDMVDTPVNSRCRKKKKKPRGRKLKSANDSIESSSHSDEKYQGLNNSEDNLNVSIEDSEPIVADADSFETQVAAKMKEIMDGQSNPYMPKSNFQIDWATSNTGKCEIVDVKLIDNIDYSDFKCNSCQKCDTPVCFVCKSPVSPKSSSESRQKCQQMHCHKYYHLECLEHWPQAQFNGGELLKKKKSLECYEAVTCPRHVCHTCVSDDPRGCKTRFSADKLARCVRCPATYHTFTKCLPAGTQILTGSHIICPRHYEHRPGKVPCHVNTGWCFICALGGILICCEYCPTSFHADCLKISPPEGGYMCEDCETGRLPLYGEMVWVKLGLYRWWPGLILHPSEVPLNIMAVRHSAGEFVVRFFGQYDHYWVNRGRVFPFQEGDSGRISSQKSKIDAAFTMAMEHAQRACQILKNANLNQAESEDIASSLLPPAYVKLKVNKPCGSLTGRRVEFEESSLTQCECDPNDVDPCGPNSSCLNRMLLTECGPTCRAGERCQNRAFEKRQYPRLAPYRTPQRGWGLKTLEDIKMGQFVIEYVGELIDEEEFRRRMARMHDVRDENFYFLTLDKERMIDAGPKGNLARFMNHCCEPNCETQKWTVLADVRVGLFALRDIPAGSEVTFNYNFECAGIEKKRCLCGAKRCSGYIGAKPKQEESQPKKPRIPGVKRVYRKRKPEESPTITKSKVPKPRTTSRSKPKELTEIEKDLLIIKSATNGLSSDSEASGRLSSFDLESDKNQKLLKRKRVSFSTESEVILLNSDAKPPSVKRCKVESDKVNDVGD